MSDSDGSHSDDSGDWAGGPQDWGEDETVETRSRALAALDSDNDAVSGFDVDEIVASIVGSGDPLGHDGDDSDESDYEAEYRYADLVFGEREAPAADEPTGGAPEDDDKPAEDSEPDDDTTLIVDPDVPTEHVQEIYIVAPEDRWMPSTLSIYEQTKLVSIRACMIAQHNNCQVDTTGLTDAGAMARRELMMRRCPLVVRRYRGVRRLDSGVLAQMYEDWFPNTMMFSKVYPEVMLTHPAAPT